MKKERPETTLFMLISIDGKISTGDNDKMDTWDFRKIDGLKEGLQQYYDIEKTTDLHSLNTGKVMKKIGVNNKSPFKNIQDVSFIIVDSKPHLTKKGVLNLCGSLKKLYLVTNNKNHPAFQLKKDNLKMIYYSKKINFEDLFFNLKRIYNIPRITIQSGGTLNATFIRKNLIDHLSLVVAPCLIGGENTSSLIDGESLHSKKDLIYIKALKLVESKVLENSYLHLKYDFLN